MQERHLNNKKYFKEQKFTAKKYIIPFIEKSLKINKNISVLEIGCDVGGNLKPFFDLGCEKIVGVDLNEKAINNANDFFKNYKNIRFIYADIYKIDNIGQFDLIVIKDVIEHVCDQKKFMGVVKKFLKPNGKIFVEFPPWHNPFGRHQQICKSKILSKIPFFHILPFSVYQFILKIFKEDNDNIKKLLEIKKAGITIERFEKILREKNYIINNKIFYFINPHYKIKFNLKPRKQIKLISSIPFFRNFFITANYYIISIEQ